MHGKDLDSQGQTEVKLIWQKLRDHVATTEQENVNPLLPKKPILFSQKPHITWGNFFSGDSVMEYVTKEGFAVTMTCRRDHLPKKIPGKYLMKEKTDTKSRSKVARFENPIFVSRKVPGTASVMQLCSFQSMSSCNIASVNTLNECELFAQQKQRGRSGFKRKWAIEMNEARQLYLATYGVIDCIDHLIQNCEMSYR